MCDTEPNRIADKEEENGGKDEHFFISPGDTHEGKDTLGKGKLVDITKDKPVKVTVKVGVPVRDHPKFNFVGKLLGPKGNSLKRLQEGTLTKMTILGRGSMRDKRKEDELRLSGDPKFSHLHDDLHIEISAFAPPAEAHARIAFALTDIRPFLVPDCNDDIRQEQMWEMEILKEHSETQNVIGRTVGLDILDTTALGSPGISNTSSSHRRQSPPRAPSKVLNRDNLPHQHQTVHSFTFLGSNVAGTVLGKKRPFLSASNRHLLPVKRTIMSILTRTRMTQLNRRFSLANRADDHNIP